MDIKQNFFEFYGLPAVFEIDLGLLSQRHLELQKKLHPDRFAHLSDQERRLSAQYTAYLNEGYATLRSSLLRAQYLLKLQGIDTHNESSTAMDPLFLMQQMELRERVEDAPGHADPESELAALGEDVERMMVPLQTEFCRQIADPAETSLNAAAAAVRKMQFLDKLRREIERLEDELY
ncbi:Fe-S protein assembly co-chaperone HscB [Marinobacterium rhizophilum]|uniref:Co-chaperone protein HscB homolog n=1 Tax=Marinobacterium rhizophilum TaxID=420402 RepID=A0ABY5HHF8_9GAMM|nr:Fe-S protein assembly co-chaperone HscB [Marinobacterium rhizophilum]UTW11787.1 Fe-S protein assembly co-chaperone HscB [Marinobacterium rhizophilum]